MDKQNQNDYYFLSDLNTSPPVYDSQREEREAAPHRRAGTSAYHHSPQVLTTQNLKPGSVSSAKQSSKIIANPFFDDHKTEVKRPENDKVSVEANWEKTRIPSMDKMQIRKLSGPFNKFDSILLSVPDTESPTDFAIAALRSVYTVFQSMAPALTFHPNSKDLRCKGSYTEGFSTCRFSAQVWKVDKSTPRNKRQYILEFHRRSQRGRDAYFALKCIVALALKREGY